MRAEDPVQAVAEALAVEVTIGFRDEAGGDDWVSGVWVSGVMETDDRTQLARLAIAAARPAIEREAQQVQHQDVRELLEAVDLGGHARPYSMHEVIQREVLPAIRALAARLAAVEALFAGGPDTPCRTTWSDDVECVEVPLNDLRAAFATGTTTNQEEADQWGP